MRITRRCVNPLFLLVLRRSDKQKKRTSVLFIVKVITVLVFLQHTLLASKGTHTEYDTLLVPWTSTDYVTVFKTHRFSVILNPGGLSSKRSRISYATPRQCTSTSTHHVKVFKTDYLSSKSRMCALS